MPKKHSRLFIIRFRIIFPKLLTPCNDDHSHLKVFGDMVRPTFFSVINVEVVFALGITCGHKEESLWIRCIASHIWISYLHIHAEKSSWHFGDWLLPVHSAECNPPLHIWKSQRSELWYLVSGFPCPLMGTPCYFSDQQEVAILELSCVHMTTIFSGLRAWTVFITLSPWRWAFPSSSSRQTHTAGQAHFLWYLAASLHSRASDLSGKVSHLL